MPESVISSRHLFDGIYSDDKIPPNGFHFTIGSLAHGTDKGGGGGDRIIDELLL